MGIGNPTDLQRTSDIASWSIWSSTTLRNVYSSLDHARIHEGNLGGHSLHSVAVHCIRMMIMKLVLDRFLKSQVYRSVGACVTLSCCSFRDGYRLLHRDGRSKITAE